MTVSRVWIRAVAALVPGDERADWIEEWNGELATRGGSMKHAWGAVADAWYLRTEGWTMDGMVRDVRTAIRGLVRSPFFTSLAGITLAVGIGANTAIFSVVDAVLIDPLPFPDSHELVSYNHEAPGLGVSVPVIPHSQAMYLHYLEHSRALEAFAVYQQGSVNLITDADPRQLTSASVTHRYFDVLGVPPLIGRGWVEGEDRPGAEPVVVLGHSLWEQSYGADPAILGRLVEMDGVHRRVVGVMPANAPVLGEEVWMPMTIESESVNAGTLSLIGVGRLADGMTLEDAQVEMQTLLLRFVESQPDLLPDGLFEDSGLAADVKPLKELFVQSVRQVLWVVFGTVGLVLLIACANVANLFLVRAEGRQRERALRTAMGASRLDLVRQYLTESVTLGLGGGLLGLGLAYVGVQGLLRLIGDQPPLPFDLGIDRSVLLFTLLISVVSGVLFGVLPALGSGARDISGSLKDGDRGSTGGRKRFRARSALVVTQVALALVLLVGSGLMLRSFSALRDIDPGFGTEGVMTFSFALPPAEYVGAEVVVDFHRRLTERLYGIPGAQSVGMIDGLPFTGFKIAGALEPTDRPFAPDELATIVELRQVTPGYFETMSIPIVRGRALEWGDQATDFRGVVVSEALAREFWPGRDAVGQQIQRQSDPDNPWEVVGVAGDARFDKVQDEPLPMLYEPVVRGTAEEPNPAMALNVVVRVTGEPLGAIQAARDALTDTDPRLPLISPSTIESIVEDSMTATSFTVLLLGIAAGVALLLGTVGIYGVVAYIVSRRTQEIGVRMALGAPAASVLRGVLGQGLRLTCIGLVFGLAGSLLLGQALASLLYGVTASDPLTLVGTAAFLATVSLIATWMPARRASRVDPVEALRAE